MTTTQRIQAIARAIDALCPFGHAIDVFVRRYGNKGVQINVHGCKSYREATEVCRIFGAGERTKSTYADDLATQDGRTVLNGEIAPGISLAVFCDGLPPSCRLERTVERVPKTQVVEVGEFMEIERVKIVCGEMAAK